MLALMLANMSHAISGLGIINMSHAQYYKIRLGIDSWTRACQHNMRILKQKRHTKKAGIVCLILCSTISDNNIMMYVSDLSQEEEY